MKKLGKEVTKFFFKEDDGYQKLEKLWAEALKTKELGPEHHLLYQVLRGKDYRYSFGQVYNNVKLVNGLPMNNGLYQALQGLSPRSYWSVEKGVVRDYRHLTNVFGSVVSEDTLKNVVRMLPNGWLIKDANVFSPHFHPYTNLSVVLEAQKELELVEVEMHKLTELKKEIQIGIDQIESGHAVSLAELQRRIAQKRRG